MPSNKSATAALSAIETDKSKILGVKVGKHNVEPGLFIPRAGRFYSISEASKRLRANTVPL